MNDEISYTTIEAAKILKVHPLTVRRMFARGVIEYFKIGREYRIRKSVLEDFMSDKRSHSEETEKKKETLPLAS